MAMRRSFGVAIALPVLIVAGCATSGSSTATKGPSVHHGKGACLNSDDTACSFLTNTVWQSVPKRRRQLSAGWRATTSPVGNGVAFPG